MRRALIIILSATAGAAALTLVFDIPIILFAYRIAHQNPTTARVLLTAVMAVPYLIATLTATVAILAACEPQQTREAVRKTATQSDHGSDKAARNAAKSKPEHTSAFLHQLLRRRGRDGEN